MEFTIGSLWKGTCKSGTKAMRLIVIFFFLILERIEVVRKYPIRKLLIYDPALDGGIRKACSLHGLGYFIKADSPLV